MIESVELVVQRNGQVERIVPLRDGATRLGRAEDNELVLSDVGVSRRHAQIVVSPGEVLVEDLGSGNGTYYFGHRIKAQPVRDGDEIVIDPFVLKFRIKGDVTLSVPTDSGGSSGVRLEVVVGNGLAGSSYPLGPRGLTMGRAEDRDVVIPDPASSRHHCQIEMRGSDFVLVDNGSANGVFVNAVRVRECTLSDGDLVRVGNTEMRFVRFDQADGDAGAHVVPPDVWNQQAGEMGWDADPMDDVPDPYAPQPTSSGGGGWLGLVLGGFLAMMAMGALGISVIAAIVVVLNAEPTVYTPPASPPRWGLKLPSGLKTSDVETLFNEGVEQIRKGDTKLALQNFYRVLAADPGYAGADKFALSAGEMMAADALERELKKRAEKRAERDGERDRLLQLVDRSGSVGRRAKQKLQKEFADDPKVRDALDLPAPAEIEKQTRLLTQAAEDLANEGFSGAARGYRKVLAQATDVQVRKNALAGLKSAERELARQTHSAWSQGVALEMRGQVSEAKEQYGVVTSQDSGNISVKLRLERLGK